MAQTIRRGGKGVRRAAAAKGTKVKVQAARKQTGNAFDSAMRWLPFSDETLHRIVLTLMLCAAAGLVWLVASLAGVPALAQEQVAALSARAGFKVVHLEVRGVNHINELKIYNRILGQTDRSMTQLDLDAVRQSVLDLSWVKDARVSRQLPDRLIVDIVERDPHAVLKKDDKLVLIDGQGHELEAVSPARAKGLLVLSGANAGGKVEDLGHLLDAAPAIKPQVAQAEWVGNRRWNLTFKSGQELLLPEGDDAASGALLAFARMDGVNRLLGGKIASFDMRAPDRIYLRVPGHAEDMAAEQRAKAAAKAAAKAEDNGTAPAPKPSQTARD